MYSVSVWEHMRQRTKAYRRGVSEGKAKEDIFKKGCRGLLYVCNLPLSLLILQ